MAGLFSKDNQPAGRGRKRGSKNKRAVFSAEIQAEAIAKLEAALLASEPWAIQEVIKRIAPTLKPVTDPDSLDGEWLRARIFEVTELEDRIKAIEEGLANNGK